MVSLRRFRPSAFIERSRHAILLTALSAACVLTTQARVQCQGGPESCVPVEVDATTPAPQGFVTALSPTLCSDDNGLLPGDDLSVPDGGYVKVGSPIRIDTAAHVTGRCDYYGWVYWGWYCAYWQTQQRTVAFVDISLEPPSLLTSHWREYAPYNSQSLDTRPGSGYGVTLAEAGSYRATFQSTVYPTNCGGSTQSPQSETGINAVACTPKWNVDGSGNLNHFPTDVAEIDIAYQPT
jgi:hypothetical protein